MQLTLDRKGDYAVRATIALARAFGSGRRKSRQLSKLMDIPERYLPQIMAPLVRAGVVKATAGPDGGYELVRPPSEVTLLEIIELAEGPVVSDHCLLEGGPCDWESICPVHRAWERAHEALTDVLRQTDFQELAENDHLIENGRLDLPKSQPHPRAVSRRGQRDEATGSRAPDKRRGK